MKRVNVLKMAFLLILGLCISTTISAQDINTFTLEIEGKEYSLTQDIDPIFIGTYTVGIGEDQKQYPLVLNKDSDFQWGAAVSEGKIESIDIMEYAAGKMVSYIAYTIHYQNITTGEQGEFMLYELDGKKYLGEAEKIESVAGNR